MITLETSLRIKFAMLELKSKDSYDNFGSGSAVASLEDSTQTIYDAARSSIVQLLTDEDPWTTATVDSLSLYEVRHIRNPHSTLHEHFAVGWSIRGGTQEAL